MDFQNFALRSFGRSVGRQAGASRFERIASVQLVHGFYGGKFADLSIAPTDASQAMLAQFGVVARPSPGRLDLLAADHYRERLKRYVIRHGGNQAEPVGPPVALQFRIINPDFLAVTRLPTGFRPGASILIASSVQAESAQDASQTIAVGVDTPLAPVNPTMASLGLDLGRPGRIRSAGVRSIDFSSLSPADGVESLRAKRARGEQISMLLQGFADARYTLQQPALGGAAPLNREFVVSSQETGLALHLDLFLPQPNPTPMTRMQSPELSTDAGGPDRANAFAPLCIDIAFEAVSAHWAYTVMAAEGRPLPPVLEFKDQSGLMVFDQVPLQGRPGAARFVSRHPIAASARPSSCRPRLLGASAEDEPMRILSSTPPLPTPASLRPSVESSAGWISEVYFTV